MDPVACLRSVKEELQCDSPNYEEAATLLSSYAMWRIRGGFEPTRQQLDCHIDGDMFFEHYMLDMGQQADLMANDIGQMFVG